jgi:hypothetical protein
MVAQKPDLKLSVVKIETTLARKAKTIAEDKGIPLSTYLSRAIAAVVAKDWPKVLRKLVDEGGDE